MASEEAGRTTVLQGTLDLIVLRTLQTMGAQHAYAIATRIGQVSGELLQLNQGTLYPALVRLEQQGWIKGSWGRTENNREARFYSITRAGEKALAAETLRWRRISGLVDKLLAEAPES
jgi:PadR family transcriptional regulator, regulatory protein PadR